MKMRFAVVAMLCLFSVVAMAGGKWPWSRRINRNVETFHITAHKNTPVELWPREPVSPAGVDAEQFRRAFAELCRDTSQERMKKYSAWVLEDCGKYGVDPFLLAALIYDQSNCRPVAPKRYGDVGQYGLTHFPLEMHTSQVRKNIYTYYTWQNDSWETNELVLDYPLNRYKVAQSRSNVNLSAAVLGIFKAQRGTLLAKFQGSGSRHYISNWFFGDRVGNPEPENRVLTARRRILHYYSKGREIPAGSYGETPLVSPLDGVPRMVLDYFGNKRGRKDGYGHLGIDLDGTIGEPVRAVADGRVTFSGMDLPGGLNHERMTVEEGKLVNVRAMPQGGGFYVTINHSDEFGSVYMHLNSFEVEYNQQVKAGEIIGTLGHSGAMKSGPHLHIEFREQEHRIDPDKYIGKVLVNPYRN